jgi:hypothetical protein
MLKERQRTPWRLETRMDIHSFCHYKNMKLVYDRPQVTNLKVSFALENNAQLNVYQWLRVCVFLMNKFWTYLDWWIWRIVDFMEWRFMIIIYLCKHSFHLLTWIYCQKGHKMHSWRLITFLEIYTLTNCIPNIWRSLKLISFRRFAYLR